MSKTDNWEHLLQHKQQEYVNHLSSKLDFLIYFDSPYMQWRQGELLYDIELAGAVIAYLETGRKILTYVNLPDSPNFQVTQFRRTHAIYRFKNVQIKVFTQCTSCSFSAHSTL